MKRIPDEILKGHTAVVGMTGAGKTSTEKLLIEQVANDGARVCVLDTSKSDWWGITSSATGKSPGLPFKILGGPRGHVPLHSSAGKVIGQLVGSGKLPLSIVDMADFEAGGIQRFFVDFAQSLWRHTRGVVYLVIEEAHEIAPKERAGFGAENMAIHWAKKLATGSRTKGIRLVVATQRVQALHNAVLGSCQTVIAHQLMFDADQTPVINWVKSVNKAAAAEVSASIASLPVGTGWICSGRAQIFEKVHFPKFNTFDNTATPEDDDDQFDVKTAPVDQDELRALIGEEAAKAEADDPVKLRAEIARLKAMKPPTNIPQNIPADAQAIENAEARGFARGFDEALMRSIRHMGDIWSAMLKPLGQAKLALDEIEMIQSSVFNTVEGMAEDAPGLKGTPHEAWTNITGKWPAIQNNLGRRGGQETMRSGSPAPGRASAPTRAPESTPVARRPPPAANGGGSLSPTSRKILDVIHRSAPVALTFEAASLRAGVSRRSSALRTYLAQVEASPEVVKRADGRFTSAPGYSQPVGPGIDPVEEFANKLPPSYARMLRTIAGEHHPLSKDQVAAKAEISPTSSGLSAGLSELIALSLVERHGDRYSIHRDLRS